MELHQGPLSSGEVHPIRGQHHGPVQCVFFLYHSTRQALAAKMTQPRHRPTRPGSIRFNMREYFQGSRLCELRLW